MSTKGSTVREQQAVGCHLSGVTPTKQLGFVRERCCNPSRTLCTTQNYLQTQYEKANRVLHSSVPPSMETVDREGRQGREERGGEKGELNTATFLGHRAPKVEKNKRFYFSLPDPFMVSSACFEAINVFFKFVSITGTFNNPPFRRNGKVNPTCVLGA